ncbi:hypothetical protein Cni_G02047 [Canna indica]|uniref:Uncharacterized protein n=1 Tax=Canna indica TaxID=4628 RepID=A0AAQ3JNZ8_9LILI|nr:hypothetical protein Cni_G02047 [Canna indica]
MHIIRSLASSYFRKLRHESSSPSASMPRNKGFAATDRGRFSVGSNSKMSVRREKSSEIDMRKPFQHKPPPRSRFSTWARWIFGSMLTLIFPMWGKKWGSLLRIGGEMETVTDAVEEVADAVEKVANVVEKVSSEVAEKLPDDGKLKDAVLLVEHVSREAAEDAHIAKDIIHKVDEMKQEVGTLFASVIDGKSHTSKIEELENNNE